MATDSEIGLLQWALGAAFAAVTAAIAHLYKRLTDIDHNGTQGLVDVMEHVDQRVGALREERDRMHGENLARHHALLERLLNQPTREELRIMLTDLIRQFERQLDQRDRRDKNQ